MTDEEIRHDFEILIRAKGGDPEKYFAFIDVLKAKYEVDSMLDVMTRMSPEEKAALSELSHG